MRPGTPRTPPRLATAILVAALLAGLGASLVAAQGAANQPPTVRFATSTSSLTVSADASESADPDGHIVAYLWQWGDGASSTGVTATHTYPGRGYYILKLFVTDDQGATANASKRMSLTSGSAVAPNKPPVAKIDLTTDNLTVTADASGSSDPDGNVTGYIWSWGDNATATEPKATHTYAEAGNYTLYLLVTDDRGGRALATRWVNVSAASPGATQSELPPQDAPPVAAFEVSASGLDVKADASASADPDGEIKSYLWDWGDGGPLGSGRLAEYAYAAEGAYTIRLTVVDANGTTATATRDVVATAPEAPASPSPVVDEEEPAPPPVEEPKTTTPANATRETLATTSTGAASQESPPTASAPPTGGPIPKTAPQDARDAPGAGLALTLGIAGAAALALRRRT